MKLIKRKIFSCKCNFTLEVIMLLNCRILPITSVTWPFWALWLVEFHRRVEFYAENSSKDRLRDMNSAPSPRTMWYSNQITHLSNHRCFGDQFLHPSPIDLGSTRFYLITVPSPGNCPSPHLRENLPPPPTIGRVLKRRISNSSKQILVANLSFWQQLAIKKTLLWLYLTPVRYRLLCQLYSTGLKFDIFLLPQNF